MVRENGGLLEVSVSDPTMANNGTINIEINKAAAEVISLSPGIEVLQCEPKIKIQVDVNKALGKTFTAKFNIKPLQEYVIINAYYHIPTKTLVDIMVTSDLSKPYIPPTVENPSEYEVKQFIWNNLISMQPVVVPKDD